MRELTFFWEGGNYIYHIIILLKLMRRGRFNNKKIKINPHARNTMGTNISSERSDRNKRVMYSIT